MGKKKIKIKKRLAVVIAALIIICIVSLLGFGIYKLGVYVFSLFKPQQEDETMYKSPAYEEILFSREDQGIWIIDSVGKNLRQLTSGDDYAPSWNEDGSSFYFLRRNPDESVSLMKFNYTESKLEPNQLQTFSYITIPNIQNSFIKISESGDKIAISSFDWGISLIDVKTGKVISNSFSDAWKYYDIFSRNSKFFLFSEYYPYDYNFIKGIDKRAKRSVLNFATTDLLEIQEVASSENQFKGYSFSKNSYTFSYSKDGAIMYVESINEIKPTKLTDGFYPSIRPQPKYKYKIMEPFWKNVDFTNVTGRIDYEAYGKKFILIATPHEIANIDVPLKKISFCKDKETNSTYLGWKLIDFALIDINNDKMSELLTSFWGGGENISAERISIFKTEKNGSFKEIFLSKNKPLNRIEIIDLNGDGLSEILNVYNDMVHFGNSLMNSLIWEDVYSWINGKYELSNNDYKNIYLELAESYRAFLKNALSNPDKFGKDLYIIKELLRRAETILNE